MTELVTESRFPDPDAAFNALVDAHRDLDARRSAALNARLVLILANHIGDLEVLQQAVAAAQLPEPSSSQGHHPSSSPP